jgi:hypothetical protein
LAYTRIARAERQSISSPQRKNFMGKWEHFSIVGRNTGMPLIGPSNNGAFFNRPESGRRGVHEN